MEFFLSHTDVYYWKTWKTSSDQCITSCHFLFLMSLTDAAVINCWVTPPAVMKHQRAVICSWDSSWTDIRSVLHFRSGPAGPDGQEQFRTPSGQLPVPAEGPVGGIQQGTLESDVLPDSYQHGEGRQGHRTPLPPQNLTQRNTQQCLIFSSNRIKTKFFTLANNFKVLTSLLNS